MGQDIERATALAAQILEECDLLEVPYDAHDEMVLNHIFNLNFEAISRWQDAEANGMRPLECHDNAVSVERSDPHGQYRAVHGWWRNGHGFVFHSVVEHQGRLTCVTPVYACPWEDTSTLLFAADPEIQRVNDEGRLVLHLFGRDVPRRLSLNPDYDRRMAAEMRARLAEGFDPERLAREPILINV